MRDTALQATVATAVADPELTLEHAKALLKQMADNVQELETRLMDYEDTTQLFSPEQLPQA